MAGSNLVNDICVLTGCNFSKENGDLQTEEEIEEDIENTQNHGALEKKNENTKDEPAEQPIVTKSVAETPEPQSEKAEELFKYNVISDDYEEVFVNNSYASSQLDDGSNYFGKIITENTALQ